MSACSIRPYADSDYPAVCAVHDRARPDELAGSCDPRAFVPLDQDTGDAEGFARSRKWVAVEQDAGTVVGFVGVDGTYLSWLYVDPAAYGRGIGRALLRHALAAIGPSVGAWTQALAENTRAIALYESEGFRVTKVSDSTSAGYPTRVARLERGADALAVAVALARALDADDFVAARELLAPECLYDTGKESLVGPEAIVASYAENSRWARATIERVGYESEVTSLGRDTAAILYTDVLDHRGQHHVHRCRQIVTVATDGRIREIRHEDLPGESTALEAFFDRAGIVRSTKEEP